MFNIKIISLILALLFISSFPAIPCSAAAISTHTYINGQVTVLSESRINISGVEYVIDKKCKYVMQYRKGRAFYEDPASYNNVRIGDNVTAKMTGGILYEIILERWKR